MPVTRRIFVRNGALAVVGTAAVPSFLTRAAFGAADTARPKRLVVIFQRGAADGLNIVVPHGEQHYYAMRPSINIPKKAVLDLDGFFGLHPSLAPFQPLWQQRHLAIIHAAGSPDTTRSHFDAQDFMETGTPGVKATDDGWLNRSLHSMGTTERSPFRAIALGPSLPRILSGSEPAVAMNNINDFSVGGKNPKQSLAANAFEAMYDHSSDSVLHTTGEETFDAVKMLKAADPGKYQPAPGANYPKGRFGDSLRQLAQLIKANLGVQVAFADIGGWDHHVNEGAVEGQLGNVLSDFSQSLAALWTDLGDLADNTVIVTMSEFGRTARENGNRGTDHGHANVMFVLGGPVKGGKVYGRWPGLDQSQLYEGRDLALTTDFRHVIGEAVAKHMGNKNLSQVFPGFDNEPSKFLKYL
jgi:uncharacterized protein (DUF1501 family)